MSRGERPATLVGQLRGFLGVPDCVIAVAETPELLHQLDAAFMKVGEARGAMLVKFHGGESAPEEELRAELERNGLDATRLEEGRLLMVVPHLFGPGADVESVVLDPLPRSMGEGAQEEPVGIDPGRFLDRFLGASAPDAVPG